MWNKNGTETSVWIATRAQARRSNSHLSLARGMSLIQATEERVQCPGPNPLAEASTMQLLQC